MVQHLKAKRIDGFCAAEPWETPGDHKAKVVTMATILDYNGGF